MNAPLPLKTRKCKMCPERFPLFRSTQVVCSPACAQKHAEAKRAKAVREDRKVTRAKLAKLKTRQEWLRDAQTWFNKYIRIRDAALPCISCQRFHTGQYHAGHYRTVGACPELRFDENNVHKQCSACNNHLSGNIVQYRINLILRAGIHVVEWIESVHEPLKLSIEDIKAIKSKYAALCKQLEKEQS